MKFLLVGVGAIGIWIGANLVQAGHTVTFVGRPRFVDAARADGLHVYLPGGDHWHLTAVNAIASVAVAKQCGPYDAIVVCVKAYSVDDVIRELQIADIQSTFVTFQNGIGSEEKFAAAFGLERVIAATLTSPVSLEAPNVIRLEREGGGVGLALVAPPPGGGGWEGVSTFTSIATAFASVSLLHTQVYGDYRAMKWSKLMLNLMGNATSALLDLSVADIYNDPKLFAVEMRMLREAIAVMNAHVPRIPAINLPGNSARTLARAVTLLPNALSQPILARRVAKGRGDKRPSLYYDVANHTGKSEVTVLNGAVAEAGRRLGVPTPVNEALTGMMVDAVNQQQNPARDMLKGKLQALA